MLLTEIFLFEKETRQQNPSYNIVVSSRFVREFPKFSKAFPTFKQNLLDFIEFRKTARADQPYNSKDGTLQGHLAGFRRVHLIHGRAILIYQIGSGYVRLIDIIDHKKYDGPVAQEVLGDYAKSLEPSDYKPMAAPTEAPGLMDDQIKRVIELFPFLAKDDPDVLRALAKNDMEDFMDWARTALNVNDNSLDQAIVKGLGGKGEMVKRAKLALIS